MPLQTVIEGNLPTFLLNLATGSSCLYLEAGYLIYPACFHALASIPPILDSKYRHQRSSSLNAFNRRRRAVIQGASSRCERHTSRLYSHHRGRCKCCCCATCFEQRWNHSSRSPTDRATGSSARVFEAQSKAQRQQKEVFPVQTRENCAIDYQGHLNPLHAGDL